MFYTYIIANEVGLYYKGSTSDYLKRLKQHNDGLSTYTKNKGPWKLVFLQEFANREEATLLEKRLKRCNKDYLNWLIRQPVNILNR